MGTERSVYRKLCQYGWRDMMLHICLSKVDRAQLNWPLEAVVRVGQVEDCSTLQVNSAVTDADLYKSRCQG